MGTIAGLGLFQRLGSSVISTNATSTINETDLEL